jgi:DNA-directed RNA polymerase specialized sigma24 family protein
LAPDHHSQFGCVDVAAASNGNVFDDREFAAIPDHADDPEAAIQKKQQNAILAYCLTKLSLTQREVLDLVYYQERSIDEVAAIICVPPGTVKTRMFYARKRIATLLSAFGMHREFPTAPYTQQVRVARLGASVTRGYIH